MGHRVIGIELEGGVLRAAVVETRLRRYELKMVLNVPLERNVDEPAWAVGKMEPPPDEEPTATLPPVRESPDSGRPRIPDLVRSALGEPLDPSDSFVVVFPGVHGFIRRFTFPFKDTNRIAATLPYQMIGQIPVQPEQIHCAFQRVGTEAGRTEVLAVAVPKEVFREYLTDVRALGVEPAHVGVDGVCLASLLPYLPPRDHPVMLVRVGLDQAEMIVARGTRVEMVRVVWLGEPAVRAGEVSPSLMREVLVTAAGASENGLSVGSVLVTGANGRALQEPLAEVLGVPCEVLDPANLDLPGGKGCPGLDPASVRAVALALGAASGGGPGSLNLLTGEFVREGSASLFRERFRLLVGALVVFAILGAARFVGRVSGLQAERGAVMAELKALSTAILGQEHEDPAVVLKVLKGLGEEDIQVFPKWTAVDALGHLVSAVMAMGPSSLGSGDSSGDDEGGIAPVGVGDGRTARKSGGARERRITPEDTAAVEIETVRIEPRSLSVRGEADTIETLDGLVERLKADPCFHEVTTESTERIQFRRHQGWQRFSLRMEVDCGEGRKMAEATTASPGETDTGSSARDGASPQKPGGRK